MAYPQIGSVPAKLSFAKIAAMPAPNSGVHNNVRKEAQPPAPSASAISQPNALKNRNSETRKSTFTQGDNKPTTTAEVAIPIQQLSLVDGPADGSHSDQNADSGDSYEEDQSQISSSSLNKPHSFDTKSLASVTTFAMDDKESIRPDDSASVRAADEDNPHAALSRNSSFQHDYEPVPKSARTFAKNVTIPGRRFPPLANPPRFGTLPISPVLECQDVHIQKPVVPILSPDDPRDPSTTISIAPDEKLMEALSSTQNRLMLLKMEEKLLAFVANGTSDVLDMPAENSFARLLVHKLADYYSLAHQVSDDSLSVKIFPSGPRVLPAPLVQLAKAVPLGSGSGPSATAVKIMRREQLGGRQLSAGTSTAPSSSVPSKATSENGFEAQSDEGVLSPAESTPSRDKSKLTREEREAQYKAVRERIFGDFQESLPSESASTGETSASMSRSSSSSGKKKTRRQKQPKDDSFEARSAFFPSYTPISAQYNSTYFDLSLASGYPVSPTGYDQDMYRATPTQAFPAFDTNMQFSGMQGFNPNAMQQYGNTDWQTMQAMQNGYLMYPQAMSFQPQNPNMMSPGVQSMQQNQHLQQVPEWYPNQYPNFMNYAQPNPQAQYLSQQTSNQRNQGQAIPYGQPFTQAYSDPSPYPGQHSMKTTKSLFNPQTRSFVPNNTEGRSANRFGRHKTQTRQSLNSNHHIPMSASTGIPISKEDSLKQKYGTPPSLPKKPPPSEVKHGAEGNILPTAAQETTSTSVSSGPLVVNGTNTNTK